ncbi:hypothetical protein [Fodinicurvata sp. EGI_FJ10296]|uniref:hypothetical protein n=1 Tax=Fodinicurvata sp. EGI_FJ10296 TaxID=3231908 RepID=UPI003453862F
MIGNNEFVRFFTVKDVTYKFVAEPSGQIYFLYHQGRTASGQHVISLDRFGYDEVLTTELDGMGKYAIIVFRKVLYVIKEWVSIKKPDVITFSAYEPKRRIVYNKLVLFLEKALKNYSICHMEDGYYILFRSSGRG